MNSYQDVNAAVIDRWIAEGWDGEKPLIIKPTCRRRTGSGLCF